MSTIFVIIGFIAFGLGIKRLIYKESLSWFEWLCFVWGCVCIGAVIVSLRMIT